MAFNKALQANIDKSNLPAYPNGQIQDNDGSGNGTPIARITASDIWEFFDKLMRLANIPYNGEYDNDINGHQYVQALQSLANKNDIVQPLTAGEALIEGEETPVLILADIAIETLQIGEFIIAQAAAAYAAQVNLQGSTADEFLNIAVSDAFQANDYVKITNTEGGIQIRTVIDSTNLDRLVTGLGYLKAATELQEITGTEDDVATTPLTNLTAFMDRVNGDSSDTFLATEAQNGLLSAADKVKIDNFADPVLNRGWVSGLDPGGGTVGEEYAHGLDIVSCECTYNSPVEAGQTQYTNYLITLANPMNNTNYFVRLFIESLGNLYEDNAMRAPVFKVIDTTTFTLSISESYAQTQDLKVHMEVYQYPD